MLIGGVFVGLGFSRGGRRLQDGALGDDHPELNGGLRRFDLDGRSLGPAHDRRSGEGVGSLHKDLPDDEED